MAAATPLDLKARAIQRPLTRTHVTQSLPDGQPAPKLPGISDAPALPRKCQPRAAASVQAAQRSPVPAAATAAGVAEPCRAAGRGGFRTASDAEQIPAGRCSGGKWAWGTESAWHRGLPGLRQQRAACGWGLQDPSQTLHSCLSVVIQISAQPTPLRGISDPKQPPRHPHHPILVLALSLSDISLRVHCLSPPIRVKVPQGQGSALFTAG